MEYVLSNWHYNHILHRYSVCGAFQLRGIKIPHLREELKHKAMSYLYNINKPQWKHKINKLTTFSILTSHKRAFLNQIKYTLNVSWCYVSTATFFLLHCDEWDRVVALPRHKFVTWATLLQLVKLIYRFDFKKNNAKWLHLFSVHKVFSPAFSITKTGRHDITEILLKVALII
jgi:hypothetical protein